MGQTNHQRCHVVGALAFPLHPSLPPSVFSALALAMKYDDGFVAYLNGTKIDEQLARTAWEPRYPMYVPA